jgi:RND family efflux transporter MFP subunit
MERLDWKILQSRRNLLNTKLIAPFSGTIRSSSVEVGKLANANDIVVSMYQADSLEARFVLTDARFGRLQSDEDGIVGRDLEVIWNVGGVDYPFKATIDRIGAEITSTSGGVEIFATIHGSSGKESMRPGAFIEIRLPDRKFADHVALPGSSLYNADTVYVVENGVLAERLVTIGAYDGDNVLISGGIEPGEEVLVTRISEISPGLKVRKEGDPVRQPAQSGQKPEEGKTDG